MALHFFTAVVGRREKMDLYHRQSVMRSSGNSHVSHNKFINKKTVYLYNN